jgi:HPt (histidine-containing phosphotransfer) domain-containing protein
MDFTDLKSKGFDVNSGFSYTGGELKYLSALQRFYEAHAVNREKLMQYFEKGDYDNYAVLAHAIKGNARMIGAGSLVTVAEALELAGKGNNGSLIQNRNAELIAEYDRVVGYIEHYGKMDRVIIPGELTTEQAQKICEELVEALEDYADEKSISLVERLQDYPFRISQKQKISEVRDHIDNFEYDEAVDIVKDVLRALY